MVLQAIFIQEVLLQAVFLIYNFISSEKIFLEKGENLKDCHRQVDPKKLYKMQPKCCNEQEERTYYFKETLLSLKPISALSI